MKKNLRVFVSSFMVGVMTATSTGIPGLSAMATFAAEDSADDAVESAAAIEVSEEAPVEEDAPVVAYANSSYAWVADGNVTQGTKMVDNDAATVTAFADLRCDIVGDASHENGLIGYGDETNRDGSPKEFSGIDGTNVTLNEGVLSINGNGYDKIVRTSKTYEEGNAYGLSVGSNETVYPVDADGNRYKDGSDKDRKLSARPFCRIEVKKDSVIKFDTRVTGKKSNVVYKIVDEANNNVQVVAGNPASADDPFASVPEFLDDGVTKTPDEYYTQEVEAKAGDVLYFAGVGTDAFLFGIDVQAAGEETPEYDLAEAKAGETYTADFASAEKTENGASNGLKFGSDTIMIVAGPNSNLRGVNDGHGTTSKPGDKFVFNVAGDAKIKFTACVYGHNTWTLTNSQGDVLGSFNGCNKEAPGHENEADKSETPQVIDYKGEADTLTLTYDPDASGETYVHALSVENAAKDTGVAESFSVWFDDLATPVDNGVDADGNPSTMMTFEQQELKYGDSSLRLVGNKNTAYEDGLERFTPNNNNANFMNLTRDGRTGVNAYKAGNRNATANDITAIPQFGDGTALVFECVGNGTFVSQVYTGSFVRVWDFDTATGERIAHDGNNWLLDTEVGAEFVAFQAQAGHTYVLSTTGKTNNCGFCSAEFAKDEEVDIDVKSWLTPEGSNYNFDGSSFTLVDSFLGTTVGKIDKNTTSIKLNVGHTYEIKSADAGVGVKFVSTDSDKIKVAEDTKEIQLSLVEIPDVKLSGSIMTSNGAAHDLKSIKFVNMVSGNVTEAVIDGDKYSTDIKPGEYNTVIESDGFTTIDKVHVEGDTENLIYLKANDPSLISLPADIQKAEGERQATYNSVNAETAPIKFNNSTSIRMSQGDSITIPVSGKQKVSVAGWYSGTWNINGQGEVTTSSSAGAGNPTVATYFTNGSETSVTITTTGEGANYLYWVKLDDVADFDASNTVIQVPSEKFPTLKDANAYIATLNNRPDGEEGRMTIELTDDIEEQIVFTEPYITVKGNGHTISWYYGVGSFYYSIDKGTGLFDEELYYDAYNCNEGDGNLWGGVAIIRGDHFIAEDTTFKNTYNYEVTEMDASDFVRSAGGLVTERVAGTTDVGIYSTKERSNAFYIDADDIQVYNCQILSSQDTFGRNGSANNGYHVYVKDSVIGGNVDYICGEFTAVFDNCELQWKTYTDDKNNNKIGYVTAAKTSPYVFRNCVITKDSDKAVTGQFGRTWGKNSNAAFLFTQTNGTIGEDGWGEMTSGDGASATFYDYCNFNGDDDAAPATKFATAISDDLLEQYTTDAGIIDILTFTPVDFMSQTTTVTDGGEYAESKGLEMIDSASDIRTAKYEIGNDTILVAAVADLNGEGITFKTAEGTVIGSSKYVYDAIELDDGTTITAKDLGLDGGYIYAVKVVGVRSAYMTAEGNTARENNLDGFSAEFGVVEEVADEAKSEELV